MQYILSESEYTLIKQAKEILNEKYTCEQFKKLSDFLHGAGSGTTHYPDVLAKNLEKIDMFHCSATLTKITKIIEQ